MEFAGIPQEGAPSVPVGPAVEIRRQPIVTRQVADAPIPKKRNLRVVFAVIVVLALGGAALALVPSIGPYGVYFVYDRIKSGDYQRILAQTVKSSQALLAVDGYPEATKAYRQAEAVRDQNRRIRGLRAYVVFVAYLREVRFGTDPEVSARAQVLLDEFKDDDDSDVAYLAQARAAQAAASGQIPRARAALES